MLSLVRITLVAICFLVLANAYTSQAGMLQSYQLEELEARQKVDDVVEEAESILIKSRNNMEAQCMRAFGNKIFCDCIANKSPLISFSEYVNMTILTKEQLQYDTLSENDKKLIDTVRKARDTCVKY